MVRPLTRLRQRRALCSPGGRSPPACRDPPHARVAGLLEGARAMRFLEMLLGAGETVTAQEIRRCILASGDAGAPAEAGEAGEAPGET